MFMRYNRQKILPEIGESGQQRLREAKVLIVGMGGLGVPISLYLTGAGVGTIGLMDDDIVSVTNLQRQILYTESDVNQPKVRCAMKRLSALNSEVNFQTYPVRLTRSNAEKIICDYDIVIDGCDNFATRYLIDDVCEKLDKVYVYGAIAEFEGQVSVFNYGISPKRYRDLYPDEKIMEEMSSSSKGVMGVTPAVVGSVEACEVLKIICGFGEVLSGKIWTIDLKTLESNIFSL